MNVYLRIGFLSALFLVFTITVSTLPGCKKLDDDVKFTFTLEDHLKATLDVEILKDLGLGLSGHYEVVEHVEFYMNPQTPESNFHFGVIGHLGMFLDQTWEEYPLVDRLPTQAPFPSWVGIPSRQITVDRFNSGSVTWYFYFTTFEPYSTGVASVIKEIDESFPDVQIGYNFYDDDGKLIIGLLFFGPWLDSNGEVVVPGGIFLGTNVKPFLPPGTEPEPIPEGETDDSETEFGHFVSTSSVNGESVTSEVQVFGRERKNYRSESEIKGLIRRFADKSYF